jgi:hypothetical protein
MGLDATVYRKKENLPFDADAVGALLDGITGEYYFSDAALDRMFPADMRRAVKKRIGNITSVSEIRQQVAKVLDEDSVVLSKVLYSSTHCGDVLGKQFFPGLEQELSLLGAHAEKDDFEQMRQFVADMNELMAAAKNEGNPIVF